MHVPRMAVEDLGVGNTKLADTSKLCTIFNFVNIFLLAMFFMRHALEILSIAYKFEIRI